MKLDGSEFAEPEVEEVSEAVVAAYEALPVDLRARWDLFADLSPLELAERVRANFANAPKERREILIAYLARRLGYRMLPGRSAKIHVQPLWDLLRFDDFSALDEDDRQLLWMIACTTRKVRQSMHPKAALAAIALWRHGDIAERRKAERVLSRLGLPPREAFLYDLVRALGRAAAESEVAEDRGIFALTKLHLDHGMCGVAALLGGLYLVRRFDPWYTGEPRTNLEKACDRAAAERPFEYSQWLLLIADSAVGGELSWSWVEPAVEAAIRLTIGQPDRRGQLRAFHERRLYNATVPRLRARYAGDLDRLGPPQSKSPAYFPAVRAALDVLEEEVERTAKENPFRAMRLLELVTARYHGQPIQQVLQGRSELDRLTERLLTLYVRTCHLDPIAVRFVREHQGSVQWEHFDDVRAEDVEIFRIVADYESTFGARDADLLGVPIVHVDKDAAARVRYFQSSRTNPNSLARTLRALELPEKLPVTHIGASNFLTEFNNRLMELFQQKAEQFDMRKNVLEDLSRVGAPVEAWEDIHHLPITKIEAALARGRQKDLLVAAATGGAAGVLAPTTTGISAIMDVPIVMSLVADTCARHCWYYGFDPREHPELPIVILAVALGGVEAQHEDPSEVRQRLQRYLVRRSILLAAIGQGVMSQMAGPAVGMLLDRFAPARRNAEVATALGRLGVRNRRSERPFARFMRLAFVPAADGLLGASFNVSLVYDLCESAQAVLADRFLARKYADWEPRF